MTSPTLYLAGPIANCSDEECIDWRQEVKKFWLESGALADGGGIIDPMVRDYRGVTGHALYREVVDLDKRDIRRCDVLLVNYAHPSVGTSMEVMYAHQIGKIVVVVDTTDDSKHQLSPWLMYHSTANFRDLKVALEWIQENVE